MKSLRFVLSVFLMSLSPVAFAQSDAHKSVDKSAPSHAQKSFDNHHTEDWTYLMSGEKAIHAHFTTD
jgi:hypothetical protein